MYVYLCRGSSASSPLVLLQQTAELVPQLHQSLASRQAQSHSILLLQQHVQQHFTLWWLFTQKRGMKNLAEKMILTALLIPIIITASRS